MHREVGSRACGVHAHVYPARDAANRCVAASVELPSFTVWVVTVTQITVHHKVYHMPYKRSLQALSPLASLPSREQQGRGRRGISKEEGNLEGARRAVAAAVVRARREGAARALSIVHKWLKPGDAHLRLPVRKQKDHR